MSTYQQRPGYGTPNSNGFAVTSLVLGITGLVTCTLAVLGIPAVICGHIGLRRFKANPSVGGKGIAIGGLACGYFSIIATLAAAGIFILMGKTASAAKEIVEQAKLERIVPANEAECHVILPEGHDPTRPIPLSIWLHGYGWNPSEITLFEEEYQQQANELKIGFVGISATLRMEGEDSSGYEWAENLEADYQYLVEVLEANADKVTPQWPRVALVGFSQGAKVAGDVASNYPEKFRGAIVISPGGHRHGNRVPSEAKTGHESQHYVCVVGAEEAWGNVNETKKYAEALENLGIEVMHKPYPGVEDHSTPPDFEERLPEWLTEILNLKQWIVD